MADIARHVIKRILNPRFLSYMAAYDVESNICQALLAGINFTERVLESIDKELDTW